MSPSKKSLLFSPLTIRGVTLKNRIVVSPMCQYMCEDGMVNDWHLVNYGSFATGGVGLIVVEATGVEARGRISPGCPGLWKDEQIEPWKRVTSFLKTQGCVAGIQIAHAGRKASTLPPWIGRDSIDDKDGGWPTIGPNAVAFGDRADKVPKEATVEDIEEIKKSFVSACERAVKAGFEVIEFHFAHGYLVSTFLSPITNQRTDKYGGSLENRMRLGLEIADSVRKALPQNIVIGARVSVTDYVENGWDLKQTIEFSKQLKKLGLDFVDCSSGGIVSTVNYGPLNTNETHLTAAAAVQKEVQIPTAAVGKIIDPLFAEKILQDNGATLIFIGRAFLNNPHWVYTAADALADEKSFKYPNSYNWCIGWQNGGKWRKEINTDKNNN
ncbi:NADPH dehydrogenase-like [Oppia nitens]|uniref:NADPH dehydrogenase-like n=1 Tax=Oppia nitens TaxID=1686743 RepID=UPI0023DA19C7|nr:NADPH dehydrogenase-like [Oppia nitens]